MGIKSPVGLPRDDRDFRRWCDQAEIDYIHRGSGSPEGVITAPVGHLYLRTDGGAGSTLYVKESGTDSSGWVAK